MLKKIYTLFRQKAISVSLLVSLIAFYQATFLNFTYYKHVLSALSINSLDDVLFFCTMPIVVFCVISALLSVFIFPKLIKLIACLLVIIGAWLSYFMSTYSIMIDRDMLQNALDTNQAESFALVTPSLIINVIILGILPSLLILFVRVKPIKKWTYYLLRRMITIILSIAVIALVAMFFYKNYATFMRNNNGIIKYLMPSNYIVAVYNQYNYLQYQRIPFTELGDDAYQVPIKNTNGQKNVMILIVGETARANNFSLGGYDKPTNSLLAKQNVIYFQNTSSCGTATAYSLPCMFSNMTRENYEPQLANKQSNALDILQKAGINILWVDNDSGCKGVCDRVPNVDITEKYKNNFKQCRDGVCYDDILFSDLPQYLDNIKSDTLIVLHTIGSHGPTYYQRYPDEYKKFTPTCDTNEINRCSQEALINTYDNTIAYTDSIINQAINLLKSYDDRYNTSLMYLSDHGESLGESNIYLHGMPYSVAPKYQTQIPLLIWLSDKYQQQENIDTDCLSQQAKNDQFSQDNLFHSLLGMFNIKTTQYQPQLNLLSRCQIANQGEMVKPL
ncbi:phosphatidylethanolamine:Kdo2-lipid A phosphoethanolamine transferase [Orbus hercynius]|uniref:Phosphatidylethanolamine:Kdo2-lipid A phosphoethanolamine transferase n=1 Tax=Orbus hercynius TaxID=593135 RepID=A0A495REZ1_9GAMM|nr:phosphoethanolamine transferase EptA [Orbus hercynius]RKS85804.1 phosphatidylethanolamine:Kdo2-lipid A phosphoethanolamine transferase [Orbus hercynius]